MNTVSGLRRYHIWILLRSERKWVCLFSILTYLTLSRRGHHPHAQGLQMDKVSTHCWGGVIRLFSSASRLEQPKVSTLSLDRITMDASPPPDLNTFQSQHLSSCTTKEERNTDGSEQMLLIQKQKCNLCFQSFDDWNNQKFHICGKTCKVQIKCNKYLLKYMPEFTHTHTIM